MPLSSLYKTITFFVLIASLNGCVSHRAVMGAPKTPAAKMCVSKCMSGQTYCQSLCDLQNKTCITKAKEEAKIAYNAYRTDQLNHHLAVSKKLSAFDRSDRCRTSCSCEQSFDTCYAACLM